MRSRSVRFTASAASDNRRVLVYDDDFGYDAMLELTGDFGTLEEKLHFAEAVAAALNAAIIPTARE